MHFAHSISHMRNRVYAPGIGRFMQPDPNATAAVLLEAASYHGRGIGATLAAFSMEDMYGDGMNLYEYLGSNPVNRSDPMGLSWDPFDAVDEYLAESAGSTAAFMERITGGMQVAAYVGAVIASMLPFPVTAIAADLGASYLEDGGGIPPQLIAARKLLGYASLATIGAFVGKMAYNATKTAIKYMMTHGLRGTVKNLIAAGQGFASKAWNLLRKVAKCGCFAAATLVLTDSGLLPIAEVAPGTFVITKSESTGELVLDKVTDRIVTHDAALLVLRIEHEGGLIDGLETTDEHPFRVVDRGWVPASVLGPGDLIETLDGVAEVRELLFTDRRATVYNLTVADEHSYLVGGHRAWVHNCWAGDHHLIPIYMGGARSGSTTWLQHVDHVDLHRLITAAGNRFGIPPPNQGASKVAAWLAGRGAEGGLEMREALIEAYQEYDRIHGTNLWANLMGEFMTQGFPP